MTKPTYLSITQVAAHCGVHRNTVTRWINSGRLQAVTFGHSVRVSEAALKAFEQPARILIAPSELKKQKEQG